MSFLSLYRKWRSQNFDEIVGQAHVTKTLKNAVANNRIAHAYLFCGPRGTGKTSTARVLAKALNCLKGPSSEPCNQCDICKQISGGSALDVIEIDAASNRGINEIRELREKVKYAPTKCKYKVYIIDEVHMLTKEAFNALLKTLEEPPGHVIFVLATTEAHKLLPTILSRCQRFDFKRISMVNTINHLAFIARKEELKIDESSLNLIANSSEGSLRDALSLLDQLISFSGKNIKPEDVITVVGSVSEEVFLKLTACVINSDAGQALTIIRKLIEDGKDINQLIKSFIKYFRDLIVIKICPSYGELVDRIGSSMVHMEDQARRIPVGKLMNSIKILTDLKQQLTWDTQWHVQTEIAILKMCQRSLDSSPKAINERLSELEEKIKNLPEIIKETKGKSKIYPPKQEVKIEPGDLIGYYNEERDAYPTVAKEVYPEIKLETFEPEVKERSFEEKIIGEEKYIYKEERNEEEKSYPPEEMSLEERIDEPFEKGDEIEAVKEKPFPALYPEEEVPLYDENEPEPYIPREQEEIFEALLEEGEEKVEKEPPKEITMAMIKKEWEDFLRKFKRENLPVYQLLIAAELRELQGKVLTLSFTNSFYKEQVEDKSYKNIIEDALEKLFNQKILIKGTLIEKKVQEMSLFGEPVPDMKKKDKKKKEEKEESPTIEDAMKIFGGEIIKGNEK